MWSGSCRRNLRHVLLQLRQGLHHVDKIPLGFGGLVMDLQECESYVSQAHGLGYYPRTINDKIKKAIAIELCCEYIRVLGAPKGYDHCDKSSCRVRHISWDINAYI